jgi:hypothetical protein
MYELYQSLFQIDQNSFIVVMVLCSCAVFIVRRALPHPLLATLIYPSFVLTALCADVLLGSLGLQPTSDNAVNLVFATGMGVTSAFAAFAALFWLVSLRSR